MIQLYINRILGDLIEILPGKERNALAKEICVGALDSVRRRVCFTLCESLNHRTEDFADFSQITPENFRNIYHISEMWVKIEKSYSFTAFSLFLKLVNSVQSIF